MAKDKYVQLGEEAQEGNFYDPTLGIKVLPGKIVKLPKNYRTSKKILTALRGGHLAVADSEDVNKYFSKSEDTKDDGDIMTEAKIKKMNMGELSIYILDNQDNEDPEELYSKEELGKEKKDDLQGIALEIFEEINSDD